MEIKWSPQFEKNLRKYSPKFKEKVKRKLNLFIENKFHPSLRYKKVKALKHEKPPVKEISIDMDVRITLQGFDDYIYLRNIGGHDILP